jgi:hypothetical protein
MANEKTYLYGFCHDLGRALLDPGRADGECRGNIACIRRKRRRSAENRDDESVLALWLAGPRLALGAWLALGARLGMEAVAARTGSLLLL